MRSLVLLLVGATLVGHSGEDAVTRPSPPLSIQRWNAPPLTLSQFQGKAVVLTFIFTSCSHCQELTQVLNRLAPEYKPRGVQFLECAFNGDAAVSMKQFEEQFKPAFPAGWTTEAVVRDYLRFPVSEKRMLYVPHMVFLDRRGTIRDDFSGESSFFTNPEASIRAELERLLKSSASSLPGKSGR